MKNLNSNVTVSYTHLDVYKRQELYGDGDISNYRWNQLVEIIEKAKQERSAELRKEAVSYTHLTGLTLKIPGNTPG